MRKKENREGAKKESESLYACSARAPGSSFFAKNLWEIQNLDKKKKCKQMKSDETEKRNPNGASSASGWAVAAYSLKIEKF